MGGPVGGFGGPGGGFGGPGGGFFSTGSSSGFATASTCSKTTTRTTKTTRPSQNTIKISIWRCFLLFFIKFDDSRHAQLSIYTVFHEESEFEIENDQF